MTGALNMLGGSHRHDPIFLDAFSDPAEVPDWLGSLDWVYSWGGSHSIWGVGLPMTCTPGADEVWTEALFAWLDAEVDPDAGAWRRGVPPHGQVDYLGGGFHIWTVYAANGRAVPYVERAVDTVLGLQQENGDFHERYGYGLMDGLWALQRFELETGHRAEEVLVAERRSLAALRRLVTEGALETGTHGMLSRVASFAILQAALPEQVRSSRPWRSPWADCSLFEIHVGDEGPWDAGEDETPARGPISRLPSRAARSGAMQVEKVRRPKQCKGEISSRGIVRLFKHRLRAAGRILDVGAGNGALAREVRRALGRDVVGLDLNARGPEQIRASVTAIPFADRAFDAIMCVDVIEHLPDVALKPGLVEILRVLSTGGRALFSTLLEEDLARLACKCPECGHVFHRVGHVQSFAEDELVGLFTAAGFVVDEVVKLHLNTYSDYPLLGGAIRWSGAHRFLPESAKKVLRHDIVLLVSRP